MWELLCSLPVSFLFIDGPPVPRLLASLVLADNVPDTHFQPIATTPFTRSSISGREISKGHLWEKCYQFLLDLFMIYDPIMPYLQLVSVILVDIDPALHVLLTTVPFTQNLC